MIQHLACLQKFFLTYFFLFWQTAVYEKSLRLSTSAISSGEMSMGRITNHMSTDAMAMLFLFQWLHHLWAIPVQVSVKPYLQVLQHQQLKALKDTQLYCTFLRSQISTMKTKPVFKLYFAKTYLAIELKCIAKHSLTFKESIPLDDSFSMLKPRDAKTIHGRHIFLL